MRFHDLRHSYATWLVSDGVPVNIVSRLMGHEQISTTLMKDAIYLPLWNVNDPFTMAPGVSGLHTTLNGYVTFHAAALA